MASRRTAADPTPGGMPRDARAAPGSERTEVDAGSLVDLFATLRPDIERFLQRRVSCGQLAADMASDLFLKVCRAGNFRGTPGEARGYLFRMAANHTIDHFRVESRRAQILGENGHLFEDEPENPERSAMVKSELALVEQALAELPHKVRAMLVYSRVHGMTHAEIAAQMGVSKSLVEKYVLRGLLHCRARMEALGEDALFGTRPPALPGAK